LKEGLSYIAHDRVISTILLLVAANGLLATPYITLLPVFARDVLRVGPEGLGFMTGAIGVGALSSGLVLATLRNTRRRGLLFTMGNLGLPTFVLVFAWLRWYPLALMALAGAGFAMIMQSTDGNALIQSIVPDELRGRVLSTWMWVGMGLTQLGGLQAGALADRWGAPVAVTVGSAVSLAIGLWAVWRRAEVRRAA
ncbi:MAG: MFS transporter, partial [Anaerolineae bacterium]|nr:MFS transporter [Anaerolineae bacterium]